jgi:hypothetical protein
MISGTTVTVIRPNVKGTDRFGNPVYGEPTRETVDGVLVAPGATADLDASRPEGATVDFTLHFPKGYTNSLEGCSVELPAPWAGLYWVVGSPYPYMDENTPTPWHMPVEVGRAHG